MKKALFAALMLAIPLAFILIITAILLPRLEDRVRPALLAYMAARVTPAERDSIYLRLGWAGSFWEGTPDPDVGAIGQANRTITDTEVEVHLNNAGMRAGRFYLPKEKGTFRIVCLGDSFVFGMGGLESDRFCDQMEAFYHEHHIEVNGQPIEAYAVGLPGWTAVQEATYLSSRLSSYDPDLIIVLTVANDIGDNFGVNGIGALTRRFSSENRALGSAVFSDDLNQWFGDNGPPAAVSWDLSPVSQAYWDKAITRLQRLADIQTGRGKKILFSVLTLGTEASRSKDLYHAFQWHFAVTFESYFRRGGLQGPLLIATLPVDSHTMLPHDAHPNRRGHRLLRDQFLNALDRLRWVTIPDSIRPGLDSRTPLRLNPPLTPTPYDAFTRPSLEGLPQEIDFGQLPPRPTRGFVGGLIPESQDPAHAREKAPWGSLRTVFLLRRPTDHLLRQVDIDFEIPPYPELFPFTLRLALDGAPVATARFDSPNQTGRYRIAGTPKVPAFHDGVVEVKLETTSYFSTIDDPRMKSYRLLHARAS